KCSFHSSMIVFNLVQLPPHYLGIQILFLCIITVHKYVNKQLPFRSQIHLGFKVPYQWKPQAMITQFIANTAIVLVAADPKDRVLDSAANIYLTPFKHYIKNYKTFNNPQSV